MVNVRYITTHPFSNDLISKILYSFQELYAEAGIVSCPFKVTVSASSVL